MTKGLQRTLRSVAALLVLHAVCPSHPVAADSGRLEPLTLQDVLSRDPRQAQAACGTVAYRTQQPLATAQTAPPNPDGPTRVDIVLLPLAVDQITAAANSFRFEGFGELIWCDPRHAFDERSVGAEVISAVGEQALERLGEMWWPGFALPAQLGRPDVSRQQLAIFSDGTIRFSAKVNSRMTARYDFRRFPLDSQTLEIVLQTGRPNVDHLLIEEASAWAGLARDFEVPEWDVRGFATSLKHGAGFTQFVIQLETRRRAGFYFWKILLPLVIIVCVAWSTFWMTRDVLAQRQRQSATAILTVIVFQFIAAEDLPRVAYLTLMDAVILWTYVCICFTLLTNVVNKRRFRSSEELGLAADRKGRRLYAVTYLLGVVAILGLQAVI